MLQLLSYRTFTLMYYSDNMLPYSDHLAVNGVPIVQLVYLLGDPTYYYVNSYLTLQAPTNKLLEMIK